MEQMTGGVTEFAMAASPHDSGDSELNRLSNLFEGPVFRLGIHVGAVFFPSYMTRVKNGFYIVPLFGAAANLWC